MRVLRALELTRAGKYAVVLLSEGHKVRRASVVFLTHAGRADPLRMSARETRASIVSMPALTRPSRLSVYPGLDAILV